MARRTARIYHASFCLLGALLIAFLLPPSGTPEQKMKVEELVARHLSSIGTPEARATAKNRAGSGIAQVTFRMPKTGQLPGRSDVISDGRMMRIAMMFSSQDNQSEQLVFNGKAVDTSQLSLRLRSPLSAFVFDHVALLQEGLMCGTMTTAWPLLDLAGRQPKLVYTGLKKLEGRQLHELTYRPKKDAGDLQIALYFDPETFRHVYSHYRLVERVGVGEYGRPTQANPAGANPGTDTFYRIEEWFDDFKMVDSLTLPHAYKLRFTREGSDPPTYICEYSISLTQVLHNQAVDPKAFVIQ
jgi:hypothetical protein